MLVREPLTVKDLETIKQGLDGGKRSSEIAREIDRAETVVRRVKLQLKSGQFLRRLARRQELEVQFKKNGLESSAKRGQRIHELRKKGLTLLQVAKELGLTRTQANYYYYGQGRKHSGQGRDKAAPKALATEQRRKRITAMREKGMSLNDISKKLDMNPGTVSYWYYKKDTNGKPAHKPAQNPPHVNLNAPGVTKEKVLAFKEQGLKLAEIAERLGVSYATVHYHMYKKPSLGKEHLNGNGRNNANGNGDAFNKHLLYGIAYAETERFITVLGERLGVPAKILRLQLSELLGHSPIRETPRDGD